MTDYYKTKDRRSSKNGLDRRQILYGDKKMILMGDNPRYGSVYGSI